MTPVWHKSCTGHFKGSHDGWGAIIKSFARKVITENPANCPITDAQSLYIAARDHFKEGVFFFCSKEDNDSKCERFGLDERKRQSKRIDGTLRLHQFSPIEGNTTHLRVKETSYDNYWPRMQSVQIGVKNSLQTDL